MMFPFDFGFIPSTLGEDGDPLDILVLMDAPAHVGCLIDVRIIGIIQAEQTQDGRLKAMIGFWVPLFTPMTMRTWNRIDEVSKTLLDQLEAFFISYNKRRGKRFTVTRTAGPKKAISSS